MQLRHSVTVSQRHFYLLYNKVFEIFPQLGENLFLNLGKY